MAPKGPADDGKRFLSDGRSWPIAIARIGGRFGGRRARDYAGFEGGGFMLRAFCVFFLILSIISF